ncbi:hypothetical protein ACB376_10705 [Klebsiella electrica]
MKETERRFITPDARIRGHASDHVAVAAVAPQQRAGDEKQRGGTLPRTAGWPLSLLARGANPVSDSPGPLDVKALSANRVNIDSLHH